MIKQRRGFTLLEILIVVGILSILLGFVFVKLKPFQRKQEAYDLKRQADIRSIEHAGAAYAIDTLSLPPGTPVGAPSVARNICQAGVTGNACTGSPVNGVDLSSLVPEFLSAIPVDPAMTGAIITGYTFYSDGEDVYALAPYIGSNPQQVTDGTQSSSSSQEAGPLVAHWKFDDNSGTTAADASGAGHDGTIVNGATWTTGLFDAALQFDGANDEVSVADDASLDGFSEFSLSVWIRPYSWKNAQIAGISDAYDLRMRSDGRIQYSVQSFLTNSVSQSIAPTNQWTHLSLVYNGSTVKLYVNGIEDTSTNATGTVAVTTTPFRIGAAANFHGKIDDVRLHRTSLTSAEIGALAATGFAGSQVAYWKFDDGSGTSAADASGNGVSATLVNGPAWTSVSTAPTNYSNSHSLRFDGTNDYVRVPYNDAIDIRNRSAFSVSTWAYLGTSMPSGAGLAGMATSGSQGWQLLVSYNKVGLIVNASNIVETSVSSNGWHHVAGVWDGQNLKLYLDGTLAATLAYATAPANSSADLLIGAMYSNGADDGRTPSYRFNEKMDDVRLFTRPLSLAEVKALAAGDSLP